MQPRSPLTQVRHGRQGLMVFMTGDIGQHGHIIAVAIINREDEQAHRFAVKQVRNAVNAVTQARGRRGLRI